MQLSLGQPKRSSSSLSHGCKWDEAARRVNPLPTVGGEAVDLGWSLKESPIKQINFMASLSFQACHFRPAISGLPFQPCHFRPAISGRSRAGLDAAPRGVRGIGKGSHNRNRFCPTKNCSREDEGGSFAPSSGEATKFDSLMRYFSASFFGPSHGHGQTRRTCDAQQYGDPKCSGLFFGAPCRWVFFWPGVQLGMW